MRNLFLFLTSLICCVFISNAQSFIGFGTDNYSGIYGVINNPAHIADSRHCMDINLIGTSFFVNNTYYNARVLGYARKVVEFEDSSGFDNFLTTTDADRKNYFAGNLDVLGPSILYSLDDKQSIGLTSRIRNFVNLNGINDEIISFFEEDQLDMLSPVSVIYDELSIVQNTVSEIGLSYARVLQDNATHFWKAGLSLKYLSGIASTKFNANDLLFVYVPDATGVPSTVALDGSATASFSNSLDSNEDYLPISGGDRIDFKSETSGIGLDLGIIYEYRPDYRAAYSKDHVKNQVRRRDLNLYKLKAGVSLLDLGRLTYKNTSDIQIGFNDINSTNLRSTDYTNDIEPFLSTIKSRGTQKYVLPARLESFVDYYYKKNYYFSLETSLSFVGKNNPNANRYVNRITLNPRYERKHFAFHSPISYVQHSGLQWGFTMRLGPITMGSSSFVNHVVRGFDKQFDFFMALKIPILHQPPNENPDLPTCMDCPNKSEVKVDRPKGYEGFEK